MPAIQPPPQHPIDQFVAPDELHFDLNNPRIPEEAFQNEEQVIQFLCDEYDVSELIQSILSAGWLDYEPLIVHEGDNVVFEGNRRLAALRLINSEELRCRVNLDLPDIPDPKPLPPTVRVRYVPDRAAARAYIGFKHINGPFKWDAFAKAKYAADWLREPGASLEIVSRTLGDSHSTVRRLVDGWSVLQQAIRSGFDPKDRSKKSFSFSHLYTAITRPSVRAFIGLPVDIENILTNDPVPLTKVPELLQLMSWLYGQESQKQPAVISSQNPDLNRLVRVLAHAQAREQLIGSRNLAVAFELVEPVSLRFRQALIDAAGKCEITLGLSGAYEGERPLYDIAVNLLKTVRNLRDAMRKRAEGEDSED